MGDVGLLLIGVILLVNGLGLLGRYEPRSALPLNVLVGLAQVVLPTLGLVLEHGDPTAPARYGPIYLFGFTYLWLAADTWRGGDGKAFGVFSAFVAVVAVVQAALSFGTDPAFAASWWIWALMWAAFWALQYLGTTRLAGVDLAQWTGWLLILGGQLSATIPALLRQQLQWPDAAWFSVTMNVLGVAVVVLAWFLAGRGDGARVGVGTASAAAAPEAAPLGDAATAAPPAFSSDRSGGPRVGDALGVAPPSGGLSA